MHIHKAMILMLCFQAILFHFINAQSMPSINESISSATVENLPLNRTIHSNRSRIIGGEGADIRQVPWQVYMYANGMACGGSIISSSFILTAAHCFEYGTDEVYFVYGTHINTGQPRVYASRVIIYPEYNSDYTTGDIALVKLSQNLPVGSPTVAVIPLADHSAFNSEDCMASGFGRTIPGDVSSASYKLMLTRLPMLAPVKCKQRWPDHMQMKAIVCGDSRQAGRSICQGDSGGPYVCRHLDGRYRLHGVTSFVDSEATCGDPAFARVKTYLGWIQRITGIARQQGGGQQQQNRGHQQPNMMGQQHPNRGQQPQNWGHQQPNMMGQQPQNWGHRQPNMMGQQHQNRGQQPQNWGHRQPNMMGQQHQNWGQQPQNWGHQQPIIHQQWNNGQQQPGQSQQRRNFVVHRQYG